MDVAGQFGLLIGVQSAGNDLFSRIECHFASGDIAQVPRGPFVDLMAHHEESEAAIRRGSAEINGLDPNLVQTAAAEPPVLRLLLPERIAQKILNDRMFEAGAVCLQTEHVSGAAGHHEQVASALPPDFGGSVLNRRFVAGGHQGANVRKIGQQFGGPGERFLSLPLEAFVGANRVAQVLLNPGSHLLLYSVADDQERGGGKSGRNSQKRQQKLRSQPDWSHANPASEFARGRYSLLRDGRTPHLDRL